MTSGLSWKRSSLHASWITIVSFASSACAQNDAGVSRVHAMNLCPVPQAVRCDAVNRASQSFIYRTMVRILYAGYLAFALYLLYPMVQNTLTFSSDCVLSALPGGNRDLPKFSSSDAHAQASRCVATAQVVERSPDIH